MGGVNVDVSIKLLNVPCLACPAGHERRYSDPEFGSQLIDEIFYSGKLPLAKLKGFIKKKRICPSCQSEIKDAVKRAAFLKWTLGLSKWR
ncbi:MAG: hypothetical protein ACT4O9_03980 [Blastocatellia bacterium]